MSVGFNNLNKLTIFILTKDRHNFLIKTLDFWSNYKINLIVLDGSKKKLNLQNSNLLEYYHIKNSSPYKRILMGLKKLKTKYVLFSGDDEIFIPEVLKNGINFLEKNKSYLSYIGQTLTFDKFINIFFFKISYFKKYSLSTNSRIKRSSKLSKNYNIYFFYAINRANYFKKNMKKSIKFEKVKNLKSLCEYTFEYLMSMNGKCKVVKKIHWIRNGLVPPIKNNQSNFLFLWKRFNLKEKFFFIKNLKIKSNIYLIYFYNNISHHSNKDIFSLIKNFLIRFKILKILFNFKIKFLICNHLKKNNIQISKKNFDLIYFNYIKKTF